MKTIQDVESNLQVSSKKAVISVAQAVEANILLAEELFELAISNRQPLAWRAAWTFSYLADCNSPIFERYIPRIINALLHISHHGQRGCFYRMLSHSKFKAEEYSELLDFSIDILLKPTIRASHKFYCLDVLEKFAVQIPELRGELIMVVEAALPNFETETLKRKGNSWLSKMTNIRP
ncbi:hypothetical protein [Williamwhitmania taraxaci]|uniref:Uncharacterized protein n=1 Tax=Williamwhitmania taraxaci TaxID=1640674 RepID=A0A1G6HI84_9BACT|nr:hypothetical protein [Williamwhitmania taraxaci]SDB93808.1 hypothetical protein SAMN05216323_101115 [Williamwhitmania taraxaci]